MAMTGVDSEARGNNNGGNNGGGRNNDGRGKNNRHRMGLAASRVAALNGRGTGDTASAGNGGRANASADGGIVVIGEINSGDNQGNTVSTGDIGGGAYGECGSAAIDGGSVDNSTNINIDAGGGTAIGDASGGNDNLAAVSGSDDGNNGGGGGLRG